MLEQRVSRLEQRMERIEGILLKLEPQITELLLTGAKQTDLQALKAQVAKVEGRLENIPTTWQVIAIMSGMLVGIAGIVFAAARLLQP
jgi:hypothetical protein